MKTRLDRLLVDRALAESREKAQALIMAGEVMVDGQKARKSGQTVAADCRLEVTARPKYVSRGGIKLEGAIGTFGIAPAGRICADIGASTGGFTDCLLQHGALRVHAVDVGTNQLDYRLRTDPRVRVYENFNARHISPADLGEPVSLFTADLSFISLTLVLPAAVTLLTPDGEFVALVKPQFEVGKGQVGKGGIVRDPELHREACERVERAVRELGFDAIQFMESPILGAEGNKEFLLYARR